MTAETSRTGSSEPRVYRYFLNGEEFLNYARGNWQGIGLHGSTETDPEIMVHMRLRVFDQGTGNRGIQIELRQAPPRTRGLRYRLGRLFGGLFRKGRNEREGRRPVYRPSGGIQDALQFAAADIRAGDEPDLAQLFTAHWNMTCQALNDDRLHIVLNRDRRPDSLAFSGTLTRA